jgi:hypothetical protein
MAAPPVSRKELSRWAQEVTGQRVSQTQLEKSFSSGAIYCQLVAAAKPGDIDMRKVNLTAEGSTSLNNYKELGKALEKIGVEYGRSMEIPLLQKGQPQATIGLLQTLYSAFGGGEGEAEFTPRGLSSLDPNAFDGSISSRKRKPVLPNTRPPRKMRTRHDEEVEGAAPSSAAEPTAPPAAPSAAPPAEELIAELEQSRAQLAQSQGEVRNLREEVSFYFRKLERIEDAAQELSPAKAPATILQILYEEEGDVAEE